MTVTRHARAVAAELATARTSAQKAAYRVKLRRLQAAADPPLSNRELAAGLGLPATAIGRFVSESPKLAKARPDGETRALIDAVLDGALLIAVEDAVAGAQRDVLVLESRDVLRLSKRYRVRNLAGGPVPARLDPTAADWNDAGSWDLFTDHAATGPGAASGGRSAVGVGAPDGSPRYLGDLVVAPVGLGWMRLSTAGRPDEDRARSVLRSALDVAMASTVPMLWDTANAYALDADEAGHNERLIRAVLGERGQADEHVVVATKAGLVRPSGRWRPDGRPEALRAACEASLRHLAPRAGALDLFLLHAVDPKVPLEDSTGALARLQSEGKVRRVGVCNVNAEQLDVARSIVDLAVVQNSCNFFDKAALERGLVQRCHELGIGFVAHSPIGGHRGVGRSDRDRALARVATRLGATPRQVALAWLLHMAPGLVPIPGATRPDSVAASLNTGGLQLDDQALAALDAQRPFAASARRRLWALQAPEIVVVMGPPAAGKTSRVEPYLKRGYLRLNRDEIGGRLDDLLPPLTAALDTGQKHVILDNTYPTRVSRQGVLEAGRRHEVPVRCVWLDVPEAEALYNACSRMLARHGTILGPEEIKRLSRDDPNMLPPAAIRAWFQRFEAPTLAEGFAAVERIAFERRVAAAASHRGLLLDVDGTLRRSTGPLIGVRR